MMRETIGGLKVGVSGLGKMGWPTTRHLQNAGAEMTVWNRTEERAHLAAAGGMEVANDPGAGGCGGG